DAAAALRSGAAGSRVVRGAFLAPWLLNGALLVPDRDRPQLTVGSDVDPRSPAAAAYLGALQSLLPGESATLAGLKAFVGATGAPTAATALTLYTPARIEFLPASLSEGHTEHGQAS